MNMVDARFRGWYYGGEATEYLSREVGSPIEPETVFVAAMRPKGVRVFLHVPPNTKDKQGQILDEGLWDLVTDRTDQGAGARHHFSKLINALTPLDGITGAFIKRDRDKQSPRELNPFFSQGRACGAWPKGCDLAFKEEDLDRLAAMLKTDKQLNKDIDERERSTYLTLIAALAAEANVPLTGTALQDVTNRFGKRVSRQVAQDKVNQIKEDADLRGWDKELFEAEKNKPE